MYNPLRNKKATKQRRRIQNPRAGTKHSDIVRRNGVGVGAPVTQALKKSEHGRCSPVFDCANFSVRYELFLAGNNSGYGVNEEGDRTIRVLKGSLFAAYENEKGMRITERIYEGGHLHVSAGTKHSYASSGTGDVELLFVETSNYIDGWELLEDGVFREEEAVIAAPTAARPGRRTEGSKAKDQALNADKRRTRRQGTSNKVVSPQDALAGTGAVASQPGVNLQPMKFAEE